MADESDRGTDDGDRNVAVNDRDADVADRDGDGNDWNPGREWSDGGGPTGATSTAGRSGGSNGRAGGSGGRAGGSAVDLPDPPLLALTNYPRMLAAYRRRGEDGLADLEGALRRKAAAQPEGKFGKRQALYVPFVPLPPLDWRHKCGHCRFWVDEGPEKPGECMIVGREGDYAGGTAIHEEGGCALFVPPAGERAFQWLREQVSPTGADLVRGEWHAPSETAVRIPVTDEGGEVPASTARQVREGGSRRHTTDPAVGDTEIPTGAHVALEPVVTGLAAPVAFVADPAAEGRWFVADQPGRIHVFEGGGDGDDIGAGAAGGERGLRDEPLLDLTDRIVALVTQYDERGLLGLALHPDFVENGRLFVRYSATRRQGTPPDYDHTEILAEFGVGDGREPLDPESERTIMEIPSPEFNHNAGDLAFGPDGYLYVAMGDGGGEGDRGRGHVPGGNGQDVTENLLGGILRIDVDGDGDESEDGDGGESGDGDGDRSYAIPADNPFADGGDGLPEYYAWGLRNPWRLSFDSEGRLFVADVGQHLFEEVNVVEAGGNYGWNVREGFHCFDPENPTDPPADCPEESERGEPFRDPILEYPHVDSEGVAGSAVVGGHVYEGEAIPALDGAYVFGDWATSQDRPSGRLFAARPPGESRGHAGHADGGLEVGAGGESGGTRDRWTLEELVVTTTESGRPNRNVLAFGRGPDGECYLCSSETHVPKGETGAVHRLVPPGEDEG